MHSNGSCTGLIGRERKSSAFVNLYLSHVEQNADTIKHPFEQPPAKLYIILPNFPSFHLVSALFHRQSNSSLA